MGISANGSIKITIEQKSTGDGGKAVEKTGDALKKTGVEAKKATEGTKSFGDSMKDLKGSFANLNSGREAFENIRSNLMFLPGVFGGIATALVSVIDLIGAASTAQEDFAKAAAATAEAVAHIRGGYLKNLDKLNPGAANQLREAEALAKNAEAYGKFVADIIQQEAVIQKAIEEHRYLMSRSERSTRSFGQFGGLTKGQESWIQTINLIQQANAEIGRLNTLWGLFNSSAAANDNAFISGLIAANKQFTAMVEINRILLGVSRDIAAVWVGAQSKVLGEKILKDVFGGAVGPTKPRNAFTKPERGRGGGGPSSEEKAYAESLYNSAAFDMAYEQAYGIKNGSALLGSLKGGGLKSKANTGDAEVKDLVGRDSNDASRLIESAATAAEMLNVHLRSFRDTIGELSPMLGEFAAPLSEVANLWVAWGASGKDTEKAIVGSLGAIAKAGASQIKNEQMRAGVLSIIEFGLGWASYAMYDYGAAAAHWTASAILAGTAIFGGGGSKSAGGGNAGSRANVPRIGGGNDAMGGSVTIVNNGMWIGTGTQQETMASFSQLLGRHAGNGYA